MTEMSTQISSSRCIFLEITDRDELGGDLFAPQAAEGGSDRYRLIRDAAPGDSVLHYHQPSDGIVGISRVNRAAEPDRILWAAKGTSARGRGLRPYWRPAWRVDLTGYTPLDPPLNQGDVVTRRDDVLRVKADLETRYGRGQHFPYYAYRTSLRTLQAYMADYPRELLALFPALARQVAAFEALSDEQLKDVGLIGKDPQLYVADEDINVAHPGVVHIDPKAMEEANRRHAKLQNLLRRRVADAGRALESLKGVANVDLAWKERGSRLAIAEVKGLTDSNEEHQLRYGLGQLLDFLDAAENDGYDAGGILFVSRPPRRMAWGRKCERVGVQLCWPGRWPKGL